jgi:hypothetical protein
MILGAIDRQRVVEQVDDLGLGPTRVERALDGFHGNGDDAELLS